MSTDTGQKVVMTYPPVLNSFDANEPVCVIEKGPETTTVRSWACSSFTNNNIQFPVISPPSKFSSIRREIIVRYTLQVCCSAATGALNAGDIPVTYPRTLLATKCTSAVLAGLRGKFPYRLGAAGADIAVIGNVTLDTIHDQTAGLGPAAGALAGVAGGFFTANQWSTSQAAMGLCLRPFPLQTACSNVALQINSAQTTMDPSRLTAIVSKRLSRDVILNYSSLCPMLPDSVSLYGLMPKGEDPFNNFSSGDSQFTRHLASAKFVGVNSANNPFLYSFYITVDEPLTLSPCIVGDTSDELGFTNVNTMQLTMTIRDLMASVSSYFSSLDFVAKVCLVPDAAYGAQPDNWRQPAIVITTSEPDPVIASKIPAQVNYYHEYINTFTTAAATFPDGNQPLGVPLNVSTTNVMLTNIPEILIISIQPTLGALQAAPTVGGVSPSKFPYVPNVYLPIERLSIQFGARVGLLSTCSIVDLWRISRKNGYTGTFDDYRYGSGGFVIINVSQDLGLPTSEVSGQLGSVPFQAEITYSTTNIAGPDFSVSGHTIKDAVQPLSWEAMVTSIHPGQFVIGQGNAYIVPVSVSKETVTGLVAKLGDKTMTASGAPSAVSLTRADTKPTGGGLGSLFPKLISKGLSHGLSFLADNPNVMKGGINFLKSKLGSFGGGDGGDLVGAGMDQVKRSRFE